MSSPTAVRRPAPTYAAPRRGGRSRFPSHLLFQVGLTLACFGLLVWQVSPAEVADALGDAGWRWVLPAAALAWLSLVAHGIRWWLLIRRSGPVPVRQAVGIILAAGGLGAVLPLRAGSVLQVQMVHRRYGIG